MAPATTAEGSSAPEDASEVTNQENVSPRNHAARQSTKQQIRHRASVACASCRDRRIRCVVPKGEAECTQCKRSGAECVIKNDDERRRPISKAYTSSLSDRIALLEGLLMEKGVDPPPAAHPPKTRQEAQSKPDERSPPPPENEPKRPRANGGDTPLCEVPSPPDSGNDDFAIHDSDQTESALTNSQMLHPLSKEQSPFRMLDPKQEDIVHRLLSTKGNLSFDQLSGRLRFFGPTANSHVYADSLDQLDSREPPEQVRRAERIIRSLTATTHEYLMGNFWGYYNSVINVINQEAFEADRESQNPKFYSSFLHIAVLAMGFRFADFEREDMRRITLASRESSLHREAKYMLDIELERPGGIPSVQALLLLGDLECGVGRDNTGWMYSGMANRLAFDIGLHLDCRSNGISDQDVLIRHMVMRACVIYDKYWALFLGRPTSIKSQDIGMDLLSKRFSQLSSLPDGTGLPNKKTALAEIFEQLIELMELAGRIVETRENNRVNNSNSDDQNNVFAATEGEDNAYLHVINLDRQLQNWYRRLPDHLQWKPANIKAAPYSFFLLHQQYHVSMLLLHRPWAKYGASSGDGSSTGSHPSPEATTHESKDVADQHPFSGAGHSVGMGDPHSMVDDSRTSLSRSICTQQAIRVARIFWQHRQRFDGRKIFVTAIQHAGTAATALIAALAYQRIESDRRTYLGYLDILSAAVSDMSYTYHPAARMDDLLKAVLMQLRTDIGDPTGATRTIMPPTVLTGSDRSFLSESGWRGSLDNIHSILPVRREAAEMDGGQAFKRRRATPSRRASEFARPAPSFFNKHTQPTPPKSSQSQNSFEHHSRVDPAMYSLGDHGNHHQFNLDFLNGNAIEQDQSEDHAENMARPSDDFVLVASQSDGWALGGMGGDNSSHLNNAYDLPMADWGSGPAGLSATSVLGGSGSISSRLMPNSNTLYGGSGRRGGAGASGSGDGVGVSDQAATGDMADDSKAGGLNPAANGGMEWMGSEGGLNALSPVSLGGLVQSAVPEKVDRNESDGTSRNHELDFFSF